MTLLLRNTTLNTTRKARNGWLKQRKSILLSFFLNTLSLLQSNNKESYKV